METNYSFRLKEDTAVYFAQYAEDTSATQHLLGVFGDKLCSIWRPGRVIYENAEDHHQVPEVRKKRWSRSRRRAAR